MVHLEVARQEDRLLDVLHDVRHEVVRVPLHPPDHGHIDRLLNLPVDIGGGAEVGALHVAAHPHQLEPAQGGLDSPALEAPGQLWSGNPVSLAGEGQVAALQHPGVNGSTREAGGLVEDCQLGRGGGRVVLGLGGAGIPD